MRHKNLSNELAHKILSDISCTPFSFGKAGVTHKDLLLSTSLNIKENDESIKVPLYYGEVLGQEGVVSSLIFVLDKSPEDFEAGVIISVRKYLEDVSNKQIRIGFICNWNESFNLFMINSNNNGWIPATLSQKLQITLAFEDIVQEGLVWQSGQAPDFMLEDASFFIELDPETI